MKGPRGVDSQVTTRYADWIVSDTSFGVSLGHRGTFHVSSGAVTTFAMFNPQVNGLV